MPFWVERDFLWVRRRRIRPRPIPEPPFFNPPQAGLAVGDSDDLAVGQGGPQLPDRTGSHPCSGQVELTHYTALDDCGPQINPVIVEGQVHGGVVQGIGWALNEEYFITEDGTMANSSLLDYRMPTSLDMPELKAILMDNPAEGTPYGMRVVGEPPIVATAAAIVNAIHDAVGAPLFTIPVGPPHVRAAMEKSAPAAVGG
mgnify:CR=1 FL=1